MEYPTPLRKSPGFQLMAWERFTKNWEDWGKSTPTRESLRLLCEISYEDEECTSIFEVEDPFVETVYQLFYKSFNNYYKKHELEAGEEMGLCCGQPPVFLVVTDSEQERADEIKTSPLFSNITRKQTFGGVSLKTSMDFYDFLSEEVERPTIIVLHHDFLKNTSFLDALPQSNGEVDFDALVIQGLILDNPRSFDITSDLSLENSLRYLEQRVYNLISIEPDLRDSASPFVYSYSNSNIIEATTSSILEDMNDSDNIPQAHAGGMTVSFRCDPINYKEDKLLRELVMQANRVIDSLRTNDAPKRLRDINDYREIDENTAKNALAPYRSEMNELEDHRSKLLAEMQMMMDVVNDMQHGGSSPAESERRQRYLKEIKNKKDSLAKVEENLSQIMMNTCQSYNAEAKWDEINRQLVAFWEDDFFDPKLKSLIDYIQRAAEGSQIHLLVTSAVVSDSLISELNEKMTLFKAFDNILEERNSDNPKRICVHSSTHKFWSSLKGLNLGSMVQIEPRMESMFREFTILCWSESSYDLVAKLCSEHQRNSHAHMLAELIGTEPIIDRRRPMMFSVITFSSA